jgi:hypothetical protein
MASANIKRDNIMKDANTGREFSLINQYRRFASCVFNRKFELR